jgi:hypothetical protein
LFNSCQQDKTVKANSATLDVLFGVMTDSFGPVTAPNAATFSEAEALKWYAQNFDAACALLHVFGMEQVLTLPPAREDFVAQWRGIIAGAPAAMAAQQQRHSRKRRKAR